MRGEQEEVSSGYSDIAQVAKPNFWNEACATTVLWGSPGIGTQDTQGASNLTAIARATPAHCRWKRAKERKWKMRWHGIMLPCCRCISPLSCDHNQTAKQRAWLKRRRRGGDPETSFRMALLLLLELLRNVRACCHPCFKDFVHLNCVLQHPRECLVWKKGEPQNLKKWVGDKGKIFVIWYIY